MLRKTLAHVRHSAHYLLATLLAVLLFYPTWARLAAQWLGFEQVLAHGLATACLFLTLVICHPPGIRRSGDNAQPPQGIPAEQFLAGGLLILLTLMWFVLERVQIHTLSYLLLPPGLWAICWSLLGWQRALAFLPYVLVLSLSLPVWADLIPSLVALASTVVGSAVRMLGMTALIEGNSITLPWGRLVIADGCSGIRYFAISVLLAALIATLNDFRWRGWAACLIVAVTLGLVANWARIFLLVLIADQTRMQSPLLADHETLGWLVYAAFVLPALYLAPVRRRLATPSSSAAIHRAGFVSIAMAFVLGPVALQLAPKPQGVDTFLQPRGMALTPVSPARLPLPLQLPPGLTHQSWRSPGPIWVSVAQSRNPARTGGKLVPYLPPPLPPAHWQTLGQSGPVQTVRQLNGARWALARRYHVGHRVFDSYTHAKLWQIPATLNAESRFALVTVMARCEPLSCQDTVIRIRNTLTALTLSAPE